MRYNEAKQTHVIGKGMVVLVGLMNITPTGFFKAFSTSYLLTTSTRDTWVQV